MPSTYTTSLSLEKQATGENSATWGTKANVVFDLIEQAIAGVINVTHDDAASYTLTATQGASNEARNMVINITGTLTDNRNLVVPSVDKLYVFKNSTSGDGYAVTVKTSGGAGISIASGETEILYCDGTNVYRAQTTPTGTGAPVRANSPTLSSPIINGVTAIGATGTGGVVFATSPTLITPNIGVATATSVNGVVLNLGPGGVSTNVALGSAALQNEATGGSIVAIGPSALTSSNGASFNTAIGGGALNAVTTGAGNTAVGYLAGWSDVTTGSYNTFLGYQSGNGLGARTGSNNTAVGKEAKPSNLSVSNEITLGNSSISALRCQVTSITSLSDRRDKTDIVPLATGLATVMALKPVRFTWDMRDGGKVGITDSGFIAQDLQMVDDCWLNLVYAENPEKLEASYGRLIPVLVKAIQELKLEVESLRAKVV